MSSILTNNSAMVALQTLKSINANLAKTQDEISTGKEIASAKDNAAIWAISKVMESDVKGFDKISDSLALGESTVAVGRQAAEAITDLLTEIKGKIVAAQEENVDRAKLQTDIDALTDQIDSVAFAAQFNGQNLVTDDTGAATMEVLSSLDRDATQAVASKSITVNKVDLRVTDGAGTDLTGGAGITGTASDGSTAMSLSEIDVVTDATSRADALAAIEGMIQQSIDAAAAFGSAQMRIETQSEFVGKLMDAMKSGIGALVDADMEEASARLQALQVQQQLGTQALSIANQSPQNILSLFR